jgi:hypothetical protein
MIIAHIEKNAELVAILTNLFHSTQVEQIPNLPHITRNFVF